MVGIGVVLAVFYVLNKQASFTQQSLITDGYKLVSSSEKKSEIYKEILERNKNDINLIALDQYLISLDRKWEALSFWCDLETNKISFLRKLNVYKKFCVMSIGDDANDKKRNYLATLPANYKNFLTPEKRTDFERQFIKIQKIRALGAKEFWKNWCDSNRIKPFWKLNFWLAENVLKYCYD